MFFNRFLKFGWLILKKRIYLLLGFKKIQGPHAQFGESIFRFWKPIMESNTNSLGWDYFYKGLLVPLGTENI